MVRVEYDRPLDPVDADFWLPKYLKDPNVEVVHTALWERWAKVSLLGTFVAFISDEDAAYLLMKYPDIEKDFHKF
jgi:hypothetical protein